MCVSRILNVAVSIARPNHASPLIRAAESCPHYLYASTGIPTAFTRSGPDSGTFTNGIAVSVDFVSTSSPKNDGSFGSAEEKQPKTLKVLCGSVHFASAPLSKKDGSFGRVEEK